MFCADFALLYPAQADLSWSAAVWKLEPVYLVASSCLPLTQASRITLVSSWSCVFDVNNLFPPVSASDQLPTIRP